MYIFFYVQNLKMSSLDPESCGLNPPTGTRHYRLTNHMKFSIGMGNVNFLTFDLIFFKWPQKKSIIICSMVCIIQQITLTYRYQTKTVLPSLLSIVLVKILNNSQLAIKANLHSTYKELTILKYYKCVRFLRDHSKVYLKLNHRQKYDAYLQLN